MYNYQQVNNSKQQQLLPLLNNLPISNDVRLMYSQLYNQQYHIPPQKQYKQPPPQQQQQYPLQYSYPTQFQPAYQRQGILPLIQSPQTSHPLPFNYNLGNMVHQPGSQIALGFDLSEFGGPSEILKSKPKFKSNPIKQNRQLYSEVPIDYLEQIQLPRIQLGETQYKVLEKQLAEQLKQQSEINRLKKKLKDADISDSSSSESSEESEIVQTIFSKQQPLTEDPPKKKKHKSRRKHKSKRKEKIPQVIKKPPFDFKGKTKVFRISLLFISLYLRTLKYRLEIKKTQVEKELKDNAKDASDLMNEWIDDKSNAVMLEIVNLKDDLQVQLGQDKLNDKKKQTISKLLLQLVSDLGKDFKPESVFTGSLIPMMRLILRPHSFPLLKYYFKFEAIRLPVNSFGTVSPLNENQQRMVMIIYLIIRCVVFQNLFIAWQFHPNQQNNEHLFLIQRNSIILSSIMHEIMIQWIEKNVALNKSTNIVKLKQLLNYVEIPLTDNAEAFNKQQTKVRDNQLIDGILTPVIVQKYLLNRVGAREVWVDKLEVEIVKLVDIILAYLKTIHEKGQLEQTKERYSVMIQEFENQRQLQRFRRKK